MTNLRARLAEVLVNPERIDILDVADFVIENADELARALEDAERLADRIAELEAECARLRALIEEHNASAIARCNNKNTCGWVQYKRRCPTCPVDDCIEIDAALRGKETP